MELNTQTASLLKVRMFLRFPENFLTNVLKYEETPFASLLVIKITLYVT